MNPKGSVLERLFTGLKRRDHEMMAACYDSEAMFEDIAFRLRGQPRIHAMWHMICETDIRATFEIVHEDETEGRVELVDHYTFQETGKPVDNVIDSYFRLENGFIVEHRDSCDPHKWATMAMGSVLGFLPGRFRPMRSTLASLKLWMFIRKHPEYR
jgi:ketosteroid isomerase-like protein